MIITDSILNIVSIFTPELRTLFLSMLPIVEMRAALPVALTVYHLPLFSALFWSFLGNVLVIPIVFKLFTPVYKISEKKWVGLHYFIERNIRSLEKKHSANYTKFGSVFLFIFVAIPLPGTGVWSASLLAIIFHIKPRPAIIGIVSGLIIAIIIVLFLTKSGIAFFQ